jgi:hypothetical protein
MVVPPLPVLGVATPPTPVLTVDRDAVDAAVVGLLAGAVAVDELLLLPLDDELLLLLDDATHELERLKSPGPPELFPASGSVPSNSLTSLVPPSAIEAPVKVSPPLVSSTIPFQPPVSLCTKCTTYSVGVESNTA